MSENPRMGSLKESFQQFVFDRCEKSGRDLFAKRNTEYQKLSEERSSLWSRIYDMLPPEGQELLRDFEDVEGGLGAFGEESAYRQGLKDGLELRIELGLAG